MIRNNLKLKDLAEEHLELVFNWRNETFIRNVMFDSNLIKWENHIKWFNTVRQANNKICKVFYYDEIPLGVANFQFTDALRNSGEWGFYLGERDTPKGMGKALAYTMLNFLFEEIGIEEVRAKVLDYNEVSLKFHEKVGFKQEDILKGDIYKDNKLYDIYTYRLLEEEWLQARKILEQELFN